jgi:FkbM family methyltransferase
MCPMTERDLQNSGIFDQWLLDASLSTRLNGPVSRARYRVLRGIRRLRLELSDPTVNFSIGECRLCLPLSHELPFYKKRFPEYALNLGRVSFYTARKYPDLTMIDIGANVGDSVAVVRLFTETPILCVEGEPRFFQLLARNTESLPEIELERTFLGAAGDHVRAVQVARGNAQILVGTDPGGARMSTLSETLACHPRFAKAKLLKLDAEGFDCKILATERNLLKCTKPVLFFEYYPSCCQLAGHDPFSTFPLLYEMGYSTLLIYRNTGEFFLTLAMDQACSLQDLHSFLVESQGFCDVVAFHQDDEDIAVAVRTAEYTNRINKSSRSQQDASNERNL